MVTRRAVLTAAICGIALAALPSSQATAKGSGLRFAHASYAPGDRAVAYANVQTWPGSGEPGEGPFAVYLVRGTQQLWYGHLPRTAVRVDTLHIGPSVSADTFRVKVDFVVPYLRDGEYAVWVCSRECGANKGFGDLTYGELVVGSHHGATPGSTPARTPPPSPAVARGGTEPARAWMIAALGVLAVITLAMYFRTKRTAAM